MDKKIHITQHEKTKLAGLQSINTSTLNNKFCAKMAKSDTGICKSCYAARYEKMRPLLHEHLVNNGELLSKSLLTDDELPKIFNRQYFRLHSFGELINKNHLMNFLRLCELNPDVRFSLWTKRAGLVKRVIGQGLNKPENLVLIYSSISFDRKPARVPNYFDKVFSVFTRPYAKDKDIQINCKGSCSSCLLCYSRQHDSVQFINEIRK